MARMEDWQIEAHEARRREMWTLRGPTQVVKVVPLPATGTDPAEAVAGYITVGKFLLGKTPKQIGEVLGLPESKLRDGARIYRFKRLPQISEYEYELTTYFPDGMAYNPSFYDPEYKPGSRTIHQWRIKPQAKVPVDSNFLDLKPGDVFPYSWLVGK